MKDVCQGSKVHDESRDGTTFVEGALCSQTSLLAEVRPLRFEEVSRTADGLQWDALVRRWHYLGYRKLVGMHLKYLIYSRRGELLAATGWSSPVWKLKSRDQTIGWSPSERKLFLESIANNSRFVIFPWVKIPHLSSHLLARQLRYVTEDWERRYSVKLQLLETFVDPARFRGTSYRAANWIYVGRTKGYAKTRNGFEYHGQAKEVYVYPLSANISKALGLQHHPEIDVNHQYYKTLAQAGQRRAQMAITKAGWNTKVAPSFAIEAEDLAELVKMFGEYYVLFQDCFGRVEHEVLSRSYLQGLMSSLERKSMEPMALSLLGESRVKALQKFINVGKWDVEKLGKRCRQEAAKTVSEPGGVFSVDGSDFPKKGIESVGVGRQYCGRLGKVDNCQAGVFAAYSSAKGHVLLKRKLFLPEQWFDKEHRERWKKCRIPLQEMIRVSTLRRPIEQCFQEGKSELGMDHYEHRSWDAWHRHMTFVLVAQLFLLRIRHRFKKKPGVDIAAGGFNDESRSSRTDVRQEICPQDSAVLSEAKLGGQVLSRQITTGAV